MKHSAHHALFSAPEWRIAYFLQDEGPKYGIEVSGELVIDARHGTLLAEVTDCGRGLKVKLEPAQDGRSGSYAVGVQNAVAILYRHFAEAGTRVLQIGEGIFAFPIRTDERRLVFEYA